MRWPTTRARIPSAGRILQLILAFAVVLVAALPFYRAADDNLGTAWFFLAIVVGALIGHAWAFVLAPVPFLLGGNLALLAQGPMPPGYGHYPGYEFNLVAFIMTIMGAVAILSGILLRGWIRRRAWHLAGPMVAVVMVLAAAWGNGVYRELYPPTVEFKHVGDLGEGQMMRLSAIGGQGTTAHTQSSPPAGWVVQESQGVMQQGQVCVPGPTPDSPPRFTVTGQRFKPEEDVRIEGEYIGVDCAVMALAGQARADATGAFTADIEAAPGGGPPPEWMEGGATFTLTIEGSDVSAETFAVRVDQAAPAEPAGTEFSLVKLFCGDGQYVPDYRGPPAAPCTAGVHAQRMGAPPGEPMRFRVARFSAAHPAGITVQEGTTPFTDDTQIVIRYPAKDADE
ncbi:MAG TPA: hypothetical protein VLA19_03090 [Herpetosiphonaceae bacterium]|nr:hypothetical protein [Herpetosiphonaceae bacterium]